MILVIDCFKESIVRCFLQDVAMGACPCPCWFSQKHIYIEVDWWLEIVWSCKRCTVTHHQWWSLGGFRSFDVGLPHPGGDPSGVDRVLYSYESTLFIQNHLLTFFPVSDTDRMVIFFIAPVFPSIIRTLQSEVWDGGCSEIEPVSHLITYYMLICLSQVHPPPRPWPG